MEYKKLTGVRKREQIKKANKTMFIGVAVASIVVAFSLVGAQFLYKKAAFNQKVISAKSAANKTLDSNLNNVDQLKSEVNKLIANEQLSSSRVKPIDAKHNNLQVVLDALPTQSDTSALGASFQHAILNGAGASIESVVVTQPSGSEEVDIVSDEPVSMPFSMILSGNYEQIKNTIKDMERVIRPMHIKSVSLQGSGDQLRATIDGDTYYLPEKTVNITKKTIKP